jgi:hypothetical protein
MNTSPEDILAKAIEVKQELDEAVLVNVNLNCGWYGNKFVHLENCRCDWEEDLLMDSRL